MTENPNLDPGIIEALGINEAELRANFCQRLYTRGRNFYDRAGCEFNLELAGLEEVLSVRWTKPSLIPQALLQIWQNIRHQRYENEKRSGCKEQDKWLMHLNEEGLRNFLEGFGSAALDTNDINTAVAAFDLTTEGGILNNEPVMQQLRGVVEVATSNGDVDRVLSLAGILQNTISNHPSVTFASQAS